jgi:hypothetical protein
MFIGKLVDKRRHLADPRCRLSRLGKLIRALRVGLALLIWSPRLLWERIEPLQVKLKTEVKRG